MHMWSLRSDCWVRSIDDYALHVALVIFMSCLLVPSAHTPVVILYHLPEYYVLYLNSPLSVGFGPVLFSPKRCFCNNTIHSLPFPIDPSFFMVHNQSINPHLLENTSFLHSWNLSCTYLKHQGF